MSVLVGNPEDRFSQNEAHMVNPCLIQLLSNLLGILSKHLGDLHTVWLCLFSLIFYHDLVGEFWYCLKLNATSPPQTTLPQMECELGR